MHAQDMAKMIKTLQRKNVMIKRLRLGDVGRISHKAWMVFKEKYQELKFTAHAFSTNDAKRSERIDRGYKLQDNVDTQEHSSTDSIEEEGQQDITEVVR